LPADDIQDLNVHAFEHYLGHPDVHVPILRLLTGFPSLISDDEQAAAVAEWRRHRLVDQLRAQVQARLEGMRTGPTPGFGPEIVSLLAFREAVLQRGKPAGES